MLNPGRCCLVGRCCYVASFVVVYRRVGVWGEGVITSCEVRWMMLNPGSCCLVGRCCYVASFVLTLSSTPCDCTREKTNGALAPANCFKQPLWTWRWKRCVPHLVHGSPVHYHMFYFWIEPRKLKKNALQMLSMFLTSLVIHGRCKIFLFQHGETSISSAMKMELRLIKSIQRKT